MARSSANTETKWKRLREASLALPEAYEDFPWGDPVAKVRGKIFAFLGDGSGGGRVSLKLQAHAQAHALSFDGAKPTEYNLGKSGWVTIPLAGVPYDLLAEWVVISYCLIAPKRLVKTLSASPVHERVRPEPAKEPSPRPLRKARKRF